MSVVDANKKLLELVSQRLLELENDQILEKNKVLEEIHDLKSDIAEIIQQQDSARTHLPEKNPPKKSSTQIDAKQLLEMIKSNEIVIQGCKLDTAIKYLTEDHLVGSNKNVIFGCDVGDIPCPPKEINALKFVPAKHAKRTLYEAAVHKLLCEEIVIAKMAPGIVKFKDLFGCHLRNAVRYFEKNNTNSGVELSQQLQKIFGGNDTVLAIVTEKMDTDMTHFFELYDKLVASNAKFQRLVLGKNQEDVFISLIFQILITLLCIQCKFPEFRHNDLHFGNVFVSTNLETIDLTMDGSQYLRYIVSNHSNGRTMFFDIPYCGLLAKMGDFGLSNLSNQDGYQTPENFKHYDKSWGLTLTANHFYDYYVFLAHAVGEISFHQKNMPNFLNFIKSVIPITRGRNPVNIWKGDGKNTRLPVDYQESVAANHKWPTIMQLLLHPLFAKFVSDGQRVVAIENTFVIDLQH